MSSYKRHPKRKYHKQPKLALRGKSVIKVIHLLQVTCDLLAGCAGVALQATVENKRLCVRNKILRLIRMLNNVKSNFSFNEMHEKDLPVMYSTVFRYLLVILLVFFWLYCITTVTPFIRRSQSWSLRSGWVLDQSQQKCPFFAEIQVCCKFFQRQPKRETSFSSLRDRLKKIRAL